MIFAVLDVSLIMGLNIKFKFFTLIFAVFVEKLSNLASLSHSAAKL